MKSDEAGEIMFRLGLNDTLGNALAAALRELVRDKPLNDRQHVLDRFVAEAKRLINENAAQNAERGPFYGYGVTAGTVSFKDVVRRIAEEKALLDGAPDETLN